MADDATFEEQRPRLIAGRQRAVPLVAAVREGFARGPQPRGGTCPQQLAAGRAEQRQLRADAGGRSRNGRGEIIALRSHVIERAMRLDVLQASAFGVDERLQRLQARITAHQVAFNRTRVGKETEVLIERKGRHAGQMIGRSPWLQSVHVETDAAPGEIVPVVLTSAGPNSMMGEFLTKAAA